MNALKDLVKLQKERKIVIKQCDKGAGLIILNFEDYMTAANKHLKETMVDETGKVKPYYKEVKESALDKAKDNILHYYNRDMTMKLYQKMNLKPCVQKAKHPLSFTVIIRFTSPTTTYHQCDL